MFTVTKNFVIKNKWRFALVGIIILQAVIFLPGISRPLYDGRFYSDWSNGFWLVRADAVGHTGLVRGRFGVVARFDEKENKSAWYVNHPQFIGVPLYFWTCVFGVQEYAVRTLAIALLVGATIMLWFAIASVVSESYATAVSLLFSAAPLVVVYGDKLDQEQLVLFFMAAAALSSAFYLKNGARGALAFFASAIVLMMWSDWSGFVFAGIFFAIAIAFRVWHLARVSLTGILLGLTIFVGQLLMQTGSLRNVFTDLSMLYRYRSGAENDVITISQWIGRQMTFFWENFGGPIGFLAIVALMLVFLHAVRNTHKGAAENNRVIVCVFALSVFFGTLLYAFIVRQASAQMKYYQFFYAIPVVIGIVEIAKYMAYVFKRRWIDVVLVSLCAIYFVFAGISWRESIRNQIIGNYEDLTLVKRVRYLPSDAKIAALKYLDFERWFDNPNIEFYAGKKIPLAAPAESVAYEYLFIINEHVDENIAILSAAAPFKFEKIGCGKIVCLLNKSSAQY